MSFRPLLIAVLAGVLTAPSHAAPDAPDPSVVETRKALQRLRAAETALADARRTDGELKVKSCEDECAKARQAFADRFDKTARAAWHWPSDKDLVVRGLVAVGETADRVRAVAAYEELLAKVPTCEDAGRARTKRLPALYAADGKLAAVLPRLAALSAAASASDRAALLVKAGDVHAALGDFASARADYAEAKRTADGFKQGNEGMSARLDFSLQSEGREYVGGRIDDADVASWCGALVRPLSTLRGRAAVLLAGGVGAQEGWSRLKEMDRLRAASEGRSITVFAWTNYTYSTFARKADKDGRRWAWSPTPSPVGRDVEVEVKPDGFSAYVQSVRARREIECPVGVLVESGTSKIVRPLLRVFVMDGTGTVTYAGRDEFEWLAPLVSAVLDRTSASSK